MDLRPAWCSAKPPNLRGIRPRLLADAGDVGQHEPGRFDRVMPHCLRHDERELRLAEHRQLARQAEYLGIGRDEAVPFQVVGMKRQQDLPVVKRRNAVVDPADRHEFGV